MRRRLFFGTIALVPAAAGGGRSGSSPALDLARPDIGAHPVVALQQNNRPRRQAEDVAPGDGAIEAGLALAAIRDLA